MDEYRSIVASGLRKLGFHVEELEETGTDKSPDLMVADENGRYFVEVKAKLSDQQFVDFLNDDWGAELRYKTGAVSKKLRDGVKQLRAISDGHGDFSRLVWYACPRARAIVDSIVFGGIRSAIFGPQWSEFYDSDGKPRDVTCFYFHSNLFARYGDLNGVVLQSHREAQLCVNTNAAMYAQFRASSLYETFGRERLVHDPLEEERKGSAFIVDALYSGACTADVVKHLQAKYGCGKLTLYQPYLVNMPLDRSPFAQE